MNSWRIAGLVLVAVLAVLLSVRGCEPEQNQSSLPAPPPSREQFHASKPLRVVVTHADATASNDNVAWLERELRHLLIHGQMLIAANGPAAASTYTLRVELAQSPPTTVTLSLVAPDGKVERAQQIEFGSDSLAQVQTLAAVLPAFLDAAPARGEWVALIGTDDSAAYADFLRSASDLLGPQGRGFARPWILASSATVNRLEALTHRHPKFARAWALLSVAYLSLGGKDEASLTQLADVTAERALALDPALTDAQAAQGLVRARHGEWAAALDAFEKVLAVDANSPPALEGLSCLLVDAGYMKNALPIARRAQALQPGSVGARECFAYAAIAAGDIHLNALTAPPLPMAAAQVIALDALLTSRPDQASAVLHAADGADKATWIDPLLSAATDPHQISQALQAVTGAANDQLIDPVTEVTFGAALRQPEFVFNRLLRLHKQQRSLPLRILWLPATGFLRQHARFEETVTAAALAPFWQDHGLPDFCANQPSIYGCKIKAQKAKPVE